MALSHSAPRFRYFAAGICALLLSLLAPALHGHLVCAALFLRLEGGAAGPAWLVHYGEKPVRVESLVLGAGTKAVRYSPVGATSPPGLVLAHGIHEGGIEEPRLTALARALSSSGIDVLTPELTDLSRYRVTYAGAETISQAAAWLSRKLGRPSVMVFGISFGGGLALRAACDPALRGPIERVIALGAHHDAHRVSRFFLGDGARGPGGETAHVAPHPYGRVVLYRSLFDEAHRGPWQGGEAARVRRALAQQRPALDRASPAHCPTQLTLPLFLLHGRGDRVIPYTETLWNQAQWEKTAKVEALVSEAIAHAEYAPPSLWERLRLVHFMARASR